MDGKGTKTFLVSVSEKTSKFEKTWWQNELMEISSEKTWSEVLADICPGLYRGGMERLRIKLASSEASSDSLPISVSRDQQVRCAIEFRPSLEVVRFELTHPEYPSGNGVSSMGGSPDVAGDAAPRPLRFRDESLEEGLASVCIGGEHPESCPSPRPEATGAEEDKGARALAEIKAAAMASQQDAFDKLGKGNNSSV